VNKLHAVPLRQVPLLLAAVWRTTPSQPL